MNHLLELIQINHSFQKSVNLQLDLDNYERIGSYIPTRSSIAVLNRYWDVVTGRSKENASILIGPYGKGKSHLLLVLLSLLHGNEEESKPILDKIEKVDAAMASKIRVQQKKYMPVLVNAVPGIDLNQSFLYALQEALIREHLENLAPDDYFTEAVKTLENWKKEYQTTYEQFVQILAEKGRTMEQLQEGLTKRDRASLDFFRESYPHLTAGSHFHPMLQMDAVKIYQQVERILVEEKGYAGIFLVFDEFSKYLEGHALANFSNDMKSLQDMCELVNASGSGMIFTMVAHKSIHEYGKIMDKSIKNAFRGVEGRIREIEFVVSAQNNYELIADTIAKKEPEFSEAYTKMAEEGLYGEIVRSTGQLSCFQKLFEQEEYETILAKGCFPLLPLCAYALLHISEKVAQNERTIFTFLAQEEQGSLSWLMQKGKTIIGTDCIYDYFKNLFRETADEPQIHNEWVKAEHGIGKTDSEEERKILKTLAIIRMIHKNEELPASFEILRLAAGLEQNVFQKAMENLTEMGLIIYRSSQGIYAFCANVGVDIEKAIEQRMEEIRNKISLCKSLTELSDWDYELPKRYNQEFSMTRYFQYEILSVEEFQKLEKSEYLFEERFSDGKILILIHEKEADAAKVQEHLKELQDERLVILLSEKNFSMREKVLKYEAVHALRKDGKFIEDNAVLLQELKLYEEDLAFEINAALEQDYLPEHKQVQIFGMQGKQILCETNAAWNQYLSSICMHYYGHSPKVNHELLNIEYIGAQYKKARNQVVKNILEGKDCSVYQKGTSPEAMVYRAAFLHTRDDEGCRRICEEMESFFLSCAGEKKLFKNLYRRLQGREYGTRRGIIPLFLAKKLVDAEGTAVIYLKKKELEISFETLNNVNDFPDQYELYIEPETAAKDQYLKRLEELFCEKEDFLVSKQRRMNQIAANMQRWYRSLPQYAMVTEEYGTAYRKAVKVLRNLLKRAELNPRELLFDRIPQSLETDDYEKVVSLLTHAVKEMDQKLEELSRKVGDSIRKEFHAAPSDSLKACLTEWYQKQSVAAKQYLLSTNISRMMSYLESLETNDEDEIVKNIAKIVSDMYLEDWNDRAYEEFKEELHQIRLEVEQIQDKKNERDAKSCFILQGADGKEITKYFDAVEKDSTSVYLQNMIEEALDDFGDTLEMNQKVAVLVQTIEKLLKN